MNFYKHYKSLALLLTAGVIALIVVYFPHVLTFLGAILSASFPLLIGAGLAFILDLMMKPITRWCKKSSNSFIHDHAGSLGMAASVIITLALIALILILVVPNLLDAVKVIGSELPRYLKDLKLYLMELTKDNPTVQKAIASIDVDVSHAFTSSGSFFAKDFTSIFHSTFNLLTSVVGSVVNIFVIIIFALFVLSSKSLFVHAYYLLCRIYSTPDKTAIYTRDLRILYNCYKDFFVGSLIQMGILMVVIAAAMYILQLPYPLMCAIIVSVINIIPMVGAFIGGGIACFIIFTVSPMKALIFLIMLCVIQTISSNVLFPKIVGNKVGLPGIFVMITIIIGGALYGVLGMILGIPLVAAIYRIYKLHLEVTADRMGLHNDPLVKDLHESNVDTNTVLRETAQEKQESHDEAYWDQQKKENAAQVKQQVLEDLDTDDVKLDPQDLQALKEEAARLKKDEEQAKKLEEQDVEE